MKNIILILLFFTEVTLAATTHTYFRSQPGFMTNCQESIDMFGDVQGEEITDDVVVLEFYGAIVSCDINSFRLLSLKIDIDGAEESMNKQAQEDIGLRQYQLIQKYGAPASRRSETDTEDEEVILFDYHNSAANVTFTFYDGEVEYINIDYSPLFKEENRNLARQILRGKAVEKMIGWIHHFMSHHNAQRGVHEHLGTVLDQSKCELRLTVNYANLEQVFEFSVKELEVSTSKINQGTIIFKSGFKLWADGWMQRNPVNREVYLEDLKQAKIFIKKLEDLQFFCQ